MKYLIFLTILFTSVLSAQTYIVDNTGHYILSGTGALADSANVASQLALKASLNGDIQWTTIFMSADTTYATGAASFVNLGQLEFNMAASGAYEIFAQLYTVRATAANGWTIALNLTQAVSICMVYGQAQSVVTAGTDMLKTEPITDYLDSLQNTGTTVTTGDSPTMIQGFLVNAASTTGFKFRWHCELPTNVTIKRGSYLMYRRIY